MLSIEDKLKLCELVENGRSLTSVAAEFNTAKAIIYGVFKSKSKLQAFLTEIQDGDCIKRRHIVRRAKLDETFGLFSSTAKELQSVVHC